MILRGHDYEHRQEIMRSINEQIEANLSRGEVVASLGLAEYQPGTDRSFRDVFSRADGLMYERKKQLKSMGAVTRD